MEIGNLSRAFLSESLVIATLVLAGCAGRRSETPSLAATAGEVDVRPGCKIDERGAVSQVVHLPGRMELIICPNDSWKNVQLDVALSCVSSDPLEAVVFPVNSTTWSFGAQRSTSEPIRVEVKDLALLGSNGKPKNMRCRISILSIELENTGKSNMVSSDWLPWYHWRTFER